MRHILYTLLCFLSILWIEGCNERKDNPKLTAIAEIINSDPKEAIKKLDSIPYQSLSEPHRHYYDFLSIKAKDKAYVWHTSDSLILDVKKWYGSHLDYGLYPEAVYYTARVYSDLGDKPTALRYFQEALDLLPEEGGDQNLKIRILSQTGRLLTSLRLYQEGQAYIRKSLALAEEMNDTLLVVQELQLLGTSLVRSGDFTASWDCFEKALQWSDHIPDKINALSIMYKALIKHKTGDSQKAVELITGIPERIHPGARNSALANAAYIFRKAGMQDSAMKYALRLIHSKDSIQKQIGFDVFFSVITKRGSFPDSINTYLDKYREILEHLYDEHESQLAIIQQSLYNYRKHDMDKKKAEEDRDRSLVWIYIVTGGLIIAIGLMIYMRFQKHKRIIQLQTSLNNLMQLKDELHKENEVLKTYQKNNESSPKDNIDLSTTLQPISSNEKELRERLKSELMKLAENQKDKYRVPATILQSEGYRKIHERIENGKIIHESDQLWDEIEKAVTASSPNFRVKLNLLTSGHLTVIDYHTALLLKCGIKPSHMAILEGRSPGSIVSRRETLGLKALDKKTGLAVVDKVIQSL